VIEQGRTAEPHTKIRVVLCAHVVAAATQSGRGRRDAREKSGREIVA